MHSSSGLVMTARSFSNRVQRSLRSGVLPACLASIAMLLSRGCETVPNSQTVFCPPTVSYSKEFQNRVADELVAHPELSHVTQEIQDYTKLRDQLAACNATPHS